MGKATSSRPRNLRRALRDSAPPLSPPRSSCSPPSPPSSFRKFIRVPEKIEHEGNEGRDDQDHRSRSDALEEVIISDHARSPNNRCYTMIQGLNA